MTDIVDTLSLIQQLRDYEPSLVKKIFDFVFVPCSEDTEGKHKYIRAMSKHGTNTISINAFDENPALEMVIVDDSVETIGYCAFDNCSSLTHVTIGNSVKHIGNGAFNNCSSLTHVTISNSVETIGTGAFYKCSKLTQVTSPDSVKIIDYNTFYKCLSLEKVYIPKHLEEQVKDNKVFPEKTEIIVH